MELASTELLVIVAVLGTIAGVVVGAMVAYKIQERQLGHADAKRFHDARLENYARLTYTANRAVAGLSVGNYEEEIIQEFMTRIEYVRMLASQDVIDAAIRMQKVVGRIMQSYSDGEPISSTDKSAFNDCQAAFLDEVKQEFVSGGTRSAPSGQED